MKMAQFAGKTEKSENLENKTMQLMNVWGPSSAKVCKSSRFRQVFSNEFFLANTGVDTAEHELREKKKRLRVIRVKPLVLTRQKNTLLSRTWQVRADGPRRRRHDDRRARALQRAQAPAAAGRRPPPPNRRPLSWI